MGEAVWAGRPLRRRNSSGGMRNRWSGELGDLACLVCAAALGARVFSLRQAIFAAEMRTERRCCAMMALNFVGQPRRVEPGPCPRVFTAQDGLVGVDMVETYEHTCVNQCNGQ